MRACIHPAAKHAAAWKYERVDPSAIKNRQLQIAVKGGTSYRLPFHFKMIRPRFDPCFDLHQSWFFHDRLRAPNAMLSSLTQTSSPSPR